MKKLPIYLSAQARNAWLMMTTLALSCVVASAQPYETTLISPTWEENFDSLSVDSLAPLPMGWVFAQGVGLPEYGQPELCEMPPHRFTTNSPPINCRSCTRSYDGDNGGATPTGGGRVNWGDVASGLTDRSIGFMSLNSTVSGSTTDYRSPTNFIMFGFVNQMGDTILSLDVTNNIKVYRQNVAWTTGNPRVSFYYSYDGTNWVRHTGGDVGPFPFVSTNTYHFNTGPLVSNVSFTISGLNVPNGSPLYLCWELIIANASGSFAQGFGLDDVGLTATLGTPPPDTVWVAGTGNWDNAANWQGGVLPTSGSTITVAGSGGAMTHNLPAVAAGTGTIKSLTYSGSAGAYTLSGLGIALIGDLVNYSPAAQVINNDLVLSDPIVIDTDSGALTLAGAISGPVGITKAGSETLTLSGAGTFSGPLSITGGAVQLEAANRLPDSVAVSVQATGTLDLNGFDQTIASLAGAGAVSLGNGTLTIAPPGGSTTFSGNISGTGELRKTGAGTQILTGANSYTGDTHLLEGGLSIGPNATIGSGDGTLHLAGGTLTSTGTRNTATGIMPNPIVMTADTIVQNNSSATAGTRNFPFGSDSITATAGTLTIRNVATGNFTNIINLRLHGTGFTFSRPIVFDNSLAGSQVNNTSQIDFASSNGTPAQIISGDISGPGRVRRIALSADDSGTTILSGNNTHTLGVVLSSGSLGLGSDTAAGPGLFEWTGNGAVFAHGGARVIDNYVYLNGVRDGYITGTHDLTFAGTMNIGTVSKGFTVENTGVTTFAGTLTNTASLTKGGAGILALTANNENSGGWVVTNGTLLVNNTTGSGTGSGNVELVAPGVLGGSGVMAGAVSGDGAIAPGASAGTLTIGGGLDLSSGGTYVWELAAHSTASGFDSIALTGGELVLGGGSMLEIQFTGTATAPDAGDAFWQSPRSWRIISLSGTASNPGSTTFASIINGSHPAGTFSTSVEPSGEVMLAFTPGGTPPQPELSKTISGAGTANATISWSAVSGVDYQVQYKTNLNQVGWLILGNVTASGDNASLVDNTGPHSQRFYRVIVP